MVFARATTIAFTPQAFHYFVHHAQRTAPTMPTTEMGAGTLAVIGSDTSVTTIGTASITRQPKLTRFKRTVRRSVANVQSAEAARRKQRGDDRCTTATTFPFTTFPSTTFTSRFYKDDNNKDDNKDDNSKDTFNTNNIFFLDDATTTITTTVTKTKAKILLLLKFP
jgi:hypothetical protein